MTDTDWDNWTGYHGTLFWMKTPEDAMMFAEWRQALNGYSLHELREASFWIAKDQLASAKFRSQHLGLLHGRIQSLRFARRQAEIDQLHRDTRKQCSLCGNSGVVTVPHIRCVADGAWNYPYSTMGVSCSCEIGRFQYDAMDRCIAALNQRGNAPKKNYGMLTLERYDFIMQEQGVDWPDIVAERERGRERRLKADRLAREADQKAPINVKAVLSAIGKQRDVGDEPEDA